MAEKTSQESKNYQTMLGEVDEIIRAISSDQLDLDDIVTKVEHGYELIKTMRLRLATAQGKIEQLQASFEQSETKPN